MPTYLSPGVYMEEVDKGPKPIEAVATAVAGFVGLAARGPLDRPISVNSWSDYVRVFGGLAPDSMMSYAAFGYFNNGGQNAYVVRVAHQAEMRRARFILPYRPTGHLKLGATGSLAVAVLKGAKTAVLASVTGLAPGDKLTFDVAPSAEEVTLKKVDGATKTVTWATATTKDHTAAPLAVSRTSDAAAPAALAFSEAGTNTKTLKLTAVDGLAVGDILKVTHVGTDTDVTVIAVDGDAKEATVGTAVTYLSTDTVVLKTAAALGALSVTKALGVGATTFVGAGLSGLTIGMKLKIKTGSTSETVLVTGLGGSPDHVVTFAPALASAYADPTIEVVPTTAFPTEYKLAEAVTAGDKLTLIDASGIASGDELAIWDDTDDPDKGIVVKSISSVAAGYEITLTAAIGAYTATALVVPNPGLALRAAPDPDSVTGGSASAQSNGMGTWGNDIQVRVDESSLTRPVLAADVAVGATEAGFQSVNGIRKGSLLRFYDRAAKTEEYRLVTVVHTDSKRVEWDGTDGLDNAYTTAKTDVNTVEFRLTFRHRWSGVTEVFDGLSMESTIGGRYVETAINNPGGEAKPSTLVEVADLTAGGGLDPEAKIPAAMKRGKWLSLSGGRNGSKDLTTSEVIGQNLGPDNRTGLAALEGVDQVTMVICADAVGFNEEGTALFTAAATESLHLAMISHAELMLDRFAILDCRKGLDLQSVQEQRSALDSKYAAFYYPWISVDNPLTGKRLLAPPSGHMAGLYARVDQQRGVHKAPANELVFGANALEVQVSKAEQDLLNPLGINCIRRFPNRGIRVWGARTISGDASWRYINVRRLFLQIEESIEEGTQWVVFEPNDQTLWAKIRRDVGAFLKRFYMNGAFFGATPEEAYFVKCDTETNPPEVIDAGQVVIEIGICPVKPAEFVIFRVGQKPTGSSVSE